MKTSSKVSLWNHINNVWMGEVRIPDTLMRMVVNNQLTYSQLKYACFLKIICNHKLEAWWSNEKICKEIGIKDETNLSNKFWKPLEKLGIVIRTFSDESKSHRKGFKWILDSNTEKQVIPASITNNTNNDDKVIPTSITQVIPAGIIAGNTTRDYINSYNINSKIEIVKSAAASKKMISRKKPVSQSESQFQSLYKNKSESKNKNSTIDTNDIDKISNFIKRLKGKIPDSVIDYRIDFFKELFKYKSIRLSQVQTESLTKIIKLKKDYKTIIEKNYSIELDLLIDMCIEKNKNERHLEKNPSLEVFKNDLEKAYLKQGIALCTGMYDDKKVTDTGFYNAFIRRNDYDGLRKLYVIGEKELIKENKSYLITTEYEWSLKNEIDALEKAMNNV